MNLITHTLVILEDTEERKMDKATKEIVDIMKLSPEDQRKYFESLPPDGTSTKLVADLEKKPQSPGRDAMIARAKAFGYDDFKFTMMYDDCVCPKIQLDHDASQLRYWDIVLNNRQGKYDKP